MTAPKMRDVKIKRAGDKVMDRLERASEGTRRVADVLTRLAAPLERVESVQGQAAKRGGKVQVDVARRYLPPRKPSRGRTLTVLAVAASAGYAIAYLLDPEQGRGRRTRLRDRSLAMARDLGAAADRRSRYTTKAVQGLGARITRPGQDRTPPDDLTLVDRVESKLFADPGVPKGNLNIEAEDGRVILRGQVEPAQITQIERAVRRIVGVRDVENLLHPAGTAAPNKAEARRAGSA